MRVGAIVGNKYGSDGGVKAIEKSETSGESVDPLNAALHIAIKHGR